MMQIGFNFWGMTMMVLFWGALITLAVGLIRLLFPGISKSSMPPTADTPNAREILNRRYARGEISHEEYQQIREELDSQS